MANPNLSTEHLEILKSLTALKSALYDAGLKLSAIHLSHLEQSIPAEINMRKRFDDNLKRYKPVHKANCFKGDYPDACKYGELDCPENPK